MAPTRKKDAAPASTIAPRGPRRSSAPAYPSPWPARLLAFAAALLILHGLIEVLPAVFLFVPAGDFAPQFIIGDLAAHWQMTLGFSVVCGLLRLAAGAGILRKMLWGWLLGIILSAITLTVLTWYLPMGVMDAVFSGPVLLLLLIGRYPEAKISRISIGGFGPPRRHFFGSRRTEKRRADNPRSPPSGTMVPQTTSADGLDGERCNRIPRPIVQEAPWTIFRSL